MFDEWISGCGGGGTWWRKSPWSTRRLYDLIIVVNKDEWGQETLPGLSTIFAAPNVSDEVAVGAHLGGWEGAGRQHKELQNWPFLAGRSRSSARQIVHWNGTWEKDVLPLQQGNGEGSERRSWWERCPISGTFSHYKGLPNEEELAEWKEKAGLDDTDVRLRTMIMITMLKMLFKYESCKFMRSVTKDKSWTWCISPKITLICYLFLHKVIFTIDLLYSTFILPEKASNHYPWTPSSCLTGPISLAQIGALPLDLPPDTEIIKLPDYCR